MTDNYTQTFEAIIPKHIRAYQACGIFFILFSVGFIILAALLSLYALIGFFLLFALGVVDLCVYNSSAKEYIYSFSPKRLVIDKKDVLNKCKRYVNVLFDDVAEFICDGSVEFNENTDILACSDASERGVCALVFNIEGKSKRLLFMPDEYMSELIKERIFEIKGGQNVQARIS